MSYFEFPHTRTYDSDLGWVIRELKRIITRIDSDQSWTIQAITEAVNKWLDEHPEATTTVEEGSIGKPQLAESIKAAADYLISSVIGGAQVSPFMEIATGAYVCQGMTYDGTYTYIALVDSADNAFIVKLDSEMNEVQRGPIISAGHVNSLHYMNGSLITINYSRLYTIGANTLALLKTETIPQRNYLSVWDENGVLIGSDGYYVYQVSNGETLAKFEPQIANTPQSVKKIGDFYVVAGINPSSLLFYKEDGSLLVSTEIDNVVDGITLNELEDISPIEGGMLASFHAESASQNYCELARIMFNGSNLKPFYGYGQQAVDALIGSTVYVDASGSNKFVNGSQLYPFKDLFQAINCIRYKYGGSGVIHVLAGTYVGRFYNCDAVVTCEAGVTIDPYVYGSRLAIYEANISALHSMQDCSVTFHSCTFPESGDEVLVYNAQIYTNTNIPIPIRCNVESSIHGYNNTPAINNLSRGSNVYTYENIQAGDSVVNLVTTPRRIGCYMRSSYGDFCLTFDLLYYTRNNPFSASVFIGNMLITVQLFVENGTLKYRDCFIYDVPQNKQIAQYRASLNPSAFPSIIRCSIEY